MNERSSTANQADSAFAPTSVRWWPMGLLLAILAVGQICLWTFGESIEGIRNLISLCSIALTVILLGCWFLFFARFSSSVVLCGATIMGMATVGVISGVRFEGFLGDMTPILAWRWSPSRIQEKFPVEPTVSPISSALKTNESDHGKKEPEFALPDGVADYPGYLGKNRYPVVAGLKLARDWEKSPPRLIWRRPVGLGWSAFAVKQGYAVTQEQRGTDEVVAAYDLASGNQLWQYVDNNTRFSEALGGDGPRATPTLVDDFVYSLGAAGQLNCLKLASGEKVWSSNILKDAGATNRTWGMSGSPLVYDDLVVVNPGGPDYSVVAYHRHTGKIAWHSGSGVASYSSPLLATLGGVRQVVMLNGPGLEGYEALTGKLLWNFPWVVADTQMISATAPLILPASVNGNQEDRILISGGYGKGSELLKLSKTGNRFQPTPIWKESPSFGLRAKFTSMVEYQNHVYSMDEKILVCLELADGSRRWKGGRYGYGQLILVEDVLLIQAENGDVVLVEATPLQFNELTRFSPLSDKTWNNAALAGNWLLVRNDREAACYELPTLNQMAEFEKTNVDSK